MPRALIALGSNFGDRRKLLDAAVQRLAATSGVQNLRVSAWHETRAIGGPPDQLPFLNGAVLMETNLAPAALLAVLEQVELDLGRTRGRRWSPRTIDLDLLLYDEVVIHTAKLTLPHPRMAMRRFVLEPAAEIAPSMVHPTIGWTVAQLLDHLRTATRYVAISSAGLPEPLQDTSRRLAAALAKQFGWRLLEFAAIPALDSPSLDVTSAIELLRQQAQMLARENWSTPKAGAVTPFWIEDLLTLGDVLWPGELDSTWQELASAVVPPKMLVIPAEPKASSDSQALHQRLAVAVRIRASRPGIGPVLWLDLAEPDAAEAELVAAIESMN